MNTAHSTENDGSAQQEPRKPLNPIHGDAFWVRLNTPEGRYAARAFAYYIMAEDFGLYEQIIERVGKEG